MKLFNESAINFKSVSVVGLAIAKLPRTSWIFTSFSVLLFVLLLTAASKDAVADWIAVDQGLELTIYANPATILESGNSVKMWGLRDFNSAQTEVEGTPYLSVMEQDEYECHGNRFRIITYSYHSEVMGKGDIVYIGSIPGDWREVTPGTVTEVRKNIACASSKV